jgi:predicted nucleic acid-binding protein
MPPAARLAGELNRNHSRKGKTQNRGDGIIASFAIQEQRQSLNPARGQSRRRTK